MKINKNLVDWIYQKIRGIDYKNPIEMSMLILVGLLTALIMVVLLKIFIPIMIIALFVYLAIIIWKGLITGSQQLPKH